MATTITPAPIRQIAPHGGELINRLLTGDARTEAIAAAAELPRIVLDEREASDVEIIAVGAVRSNSH